MKTPVALVLLALTAMLSLPPIPDQDVMLYSTLNDRRTREALRVLVLAFQ